MAKKIRIGHVIGASSSPSSAPHGVLTEVSTDGRPHAALTVTGVSGADGATLKRHATVLLDADGLRAVIADASSALALIEAPTPTPTATVMKYTATGIGYADGGVL